MKFIKVLLLLLIIYMVYSFSLTPNIYYYGSDYIAENFKQPIKKQKLDETIDQIINLSDYDSTQFHKLYKLYTKFDLGNKSSYPMIVSDADNDDRIEFYGTWLSTDTLNHIRAGIFEYDGNISFSKHKLFIDDSINYYNSIGDSLSDFDNDGKLEINFCKNNQVNGSINNGFANFEANEFNTIPDSLNFIVNNFPANSGSIRFSDVDDDELVDFLAVGNVDSIYNYYTPYIAEYDPKINTFKIVYIFYPPTKTFIYNFGIGDIDNDGKNDFVCCSWDGDVFVIENIGDNQYELVWSTLINCSNVNMTSVTNDIDSNGRKEFFVAGDGYVDGVGGTKLYWFESVGDNVYEICKVTFITGTGWYSENGLHSHDIDGDLIEDLIFDFGMTNVFFVLKTDSNKNFSVYVYNNLADILDEENLDAVTLYKPKDELHSDIIFSTHYYPSDKKFMSYYYKYTVPNTLETPAHLPSKITLYQNYPNPFNSETTIKFYINRPGYITLKIFDV